MTTLKPNGISHTIYPDIPPRNYNEWMEFITRKKAFKPCQCQTEEQTSCTHLTNH